MTTEYDPPAPAIALPARCPITVAVAEDAFAWVATGRSLAAFARSIEPDRHKAELLAHSLRDWFARVPAWRVAYDAARIERCEVLAEDMLAIADDSSGDVVFGPNDEARCDTEFVARSKLRVDTRAKLIACWNPARYGDRQQVDIAGQLNVTVTPTERRARIEAILRDGAARAIEAPAPVEDDPPPAIQ